MHGYLDVSGGHKIYYEVHGKGRPAVILHGGPGGGIQKNSHLIYDLTKWCVVKFDQRGCGKSTPFASLENNTTWDLIEDIEALRKLLQFDAWFVSGGSWGSTLALAYAEMYPSRVTGLLLRGVCFTNAQSEKWLYQEGGASNVYPEAWDKFMSPLPPSVRKGTYDDVKQYYYKKLTSSNQQTVEKYAKAWWAWEAAISYLFPMPDDSTLKETIAISRIEAHYFVNYCWLKPDQLEKNLRKLKKIPITIVHGRYDMVCPITQAYAIKKALPHTKLIIVKDAGHAASHDGIRRALTDALKGRANKTRNYTLKRSSSA